MHAIQRCLTTTTAISHSSLNPAPPVFTAINRIYLRTISILYTLMCLYLQVVYSLHREYNFLRTLLSSHACYLWHEMGLPGLSIPIMCGKDNSSWSCSLWNFLHLLWFLSLRSEYSPQQSALCLFFAIYRFFRKTVNHFQKTFVIRSSEQHERFCSPRGKLHLHVSDIVALMGARKRGKIISISPLSAQSWEKMRSLTEIMFKNCYCYSSNLCTVFS